MSYPNHNNYERSSRQSPPSVDSHSGSLYAEQGTISLLPLTVTFPTPFDPPGLSLSSLRHIRTQPSPLLTQCPTITKIHTLDLKVVRHIRTKCLIMDSKMLGSVLKIGTFFLPRYPRLSINVSPFSGPTRSQRWPT